MSGTDHAEVTDAGPEAGVGSQGRVAGRSADPGARRGRGTPRGATLDLDAAGRVVTVTARFEAPNEGAVARLNCRAMLPVSGVRRCDSRGP
ncbi:MAG: hypothetical protein V5A62_17590 [Haloarculaceae archaeon]